MATLSEAIEALRDACANGGPYRQSHAEDDLLETIAAERAAAVAAERGA